MSVKHTRASTIPTAITHPNTKNMAIRLNGMAIRIVMTISNIHSKFIRKSSIIIYR